MALRRLAFLLGSGARAETSRKGTRSSERARGRLAAAAKAGRGEGKANRASKAVGVSAAQRPRPSPCKALGALDSGAEASRQRGSRGGEVNRQTSETGSRTRIGQCAGRGGGCCVVGFFCFVLCLWFFFPFFLFLPGEQRLYCWCCLPACMHAGSRLAGWLATAAARDPPQLSPRRGFILTAAAVGRVRAPSRRWRLPGRRPSCPARPDDGEVPQQGRPLRRGASPLGIALTDPRWNRSS